MINLRQAAVLGFLLPWAISSAAMAQETRSFSEFGFEGGVAFSKFGGKDATEANGTYTGIALGGFAKIRLSHLFAIVPEAMFVQKGSKQTETGETSSVRIGYVEVPLLLEMRISQAPGRQIRPRLYAGGAVAFKVGCHIDEDTASQSCADAGAKIKSTDLALVVGGGLGVGRAVVDLRYDLGLTKPDGSNPPADFKNRTLYLLVGWEFGHKR